MNNWVFSNNFFEYICLSAALVYFCVIFCLNIVLPDDVSNFTSIRWVLHKKVWKFFCTFNDFSNKSRKVKSSSCTHTCKYIFFVLCIDNVIGSSDIVCAPPLFEKSLKCRLLKTKEIYSIILLVMLCKVTNIVFCG